MIAVELHKFLYETIRDGIGPTADEDAIPRYHWRIFEALYTLESTLDELSSLVTELDHAKSITAAKVRIKYYHVLWISITDQLALLTSEAFDLGMDPRDVRLHSVLRNRNVDPNLKRVLRKHASQMKEATFRRIRNEIVHQGAFDDSALQDAWEASIHREIRRDTESADAFALSLNVIVVQLNQHLDATRDFLEEYIAYLETNVHKGSPRLAR